MPRCWQCDEELIQGSLFCKQCDALQPPKPGRSHFEVLGVPEDYFIGVKTLERAFKTLSRQLHPDRFVMSGPRVKRFSMEHATALNDAYRTLKTQDGRAHYLLELWGRPITENSARKIQLPFDFLESVIDLREQISDARRQNDKGAIEKAMASVHEKTSELNTLLDSLFGTHAEKIGDEQTSFLDKIEQTIHQGRYLDSILREAKKHGLR